MKEVFYRLTHRPDGSYINPLIYIFFYITLVFGFSFCFFGHTHAVESVVLYQETHARFDNSGVSVWGALAMVTSVWNIIGIATRKFTDVAAFFGFALWCYAALVYTGGGYWFQVIAASLPNVVFWGWYYLRLRRYVSWLRRNTEPGLIDPR